MPAPLRLGANLSSRRNHYAVPGSRSNSTAATGSLAACATLVTLLTRAGESMKAREAPDLGASVAATITVLDSTACGAGSGSGKVPLGASTAGIIASAGIAPSSTAEVFAGRVRLDRPFWPVGRKSCPVGGPSRQTPKTTADSAKAPTNRRMTRTLLPAFSVLPAMPWSAAHAVAGQPTAIPSAPPA